MPEVTTTPFERAVSAWVLALPNTWTNVRWDALSHTQEAALDRLVKGGFVEARIPVLLNVRGLLVPKRTLWRVSGAYGPVLGEHVKQYLTAHGYAGKETGITCGDYESVRLTAEGELAKQDFQGTVEVETAYGSDGSIDRKFQPGVNYDLFSLVSGGPDGSRGVKLRGTVRFESETVSSAVNDGSNSQRVGSASKQRRFAVALSFPGERRPFVEGVDTALAHFMPRDKVFYDARHRAELARPGLDAYLQSIYHDQSELVVVFLCNEYNEKEWCGLELRAVRDLLKKRRLDDIMFVRFDDAEVPGVYSIDGYIDANTVPPEELAQCIVERLELNRSSGQAD